MDGSILSQTDIEAIADLVAAAIRGKREPHERERAVVVEVMPRRPRHAPSGERRALAISLSNVRPDNAAEHDMPEPMKLALLKIWERGGIMAAGGSR